jgi:hypothetical protein
MVARRLATISWQPKYTCNAPAEIAPAFLATARAVNCPASIMVYPPSIPWLLAIGALKSAVRADSRQKNLVTFQRKAVDK